jgi:hypothetical protein
MKDYESGFLALILAGVLMMVIGLGLMVSAARSSGDSAFLEQRTRPPASALVMRLPDSGSPAVRVR